MKKLTKELTKEEKEYIIDELISCLDSCNTSNIKINKKNVLKFNNKDIDLKDGEINICKNIIRKIK